MKILKKCGGVLEHALRRRCIEPCSTEGYINALEDILTRAKIARTWRKLDGPDKPTKPVKPNTPSTNEQQKYHKCGGIGHLANNCLKKAKNNEIVEKEHQNDKEYEYHSE
ncbi:hypothetical protein O181_104489 [Austropuccinia psidii MF-1]|uniref:CCHC-type domain-containing protein n=1 Tax=Austropuccinia psidii MF-1 TaxID=1389203 RepID=A0A9Q3JN86_9BASI|nr:hypothetical protein [Austropuccinia psidii MF-1]